MNRSTLSMLAAALALSLTTVAAGVAEAGDSRRWTETTPPSGAQHRHDDRGERRGERRRHDDRDDGRYAREHRGKDARWARDDRREHWRDHRRYDDWRHGDRRYGDRRHIERRHGNRHPPAHHYYRPPHRGPAYYAPSHYRWKRGAYLPRHYWGRPYVMHDWRHYRLRPPPRGYHWVRVERDVLLTALATGLVLDVLYDYF